jgi:uncharacterized protein
VPSRVKPPPLPLEPREYHQFYRAPAFRWWKPLAAIAMFGGLWVVASILIMIGPLLAQYASTGSLPASESDLNSPIWFAVNNVSLAVAVPLALWTSWVVFRQRPKWLSSITGGFRWGVFGRFFAIVAPVWVLSMVIETVLAGGFGDLSWNDDSLFLILTIVITTPFQAAGEEYMMRGLVGRSVGSWFSNRWAGLVVSTLVTSVVFMLLHGAGDPWLNAFYLLVGMVFSILVWRTGGLEAAVAMHVVNNLVSEALLPFSSEAMTHLFDRQAGVAGPETLIQMGLTVLVGGLLLWQSSRLGLRPAAAPGIEIEQTPALGVR